MRYALVARMGARSFQDLECWQLSNELKQRIYAFTAIPPTSSDFEFCRQIRGSARGAPQTIAEGFGRFRPRDFARYIQYARASLFETQNHIVDGFDCGYLSATDRDALIVLSNRALGAATRLHQYLETAKEPQRRGARDREP